MVMISLGWIVFNACTHQPYVLPEGSRTGDPSICFERDILPIFISNCAKSGCHDSHSGESGYVLESYADITRKGIVPGNSAASRIWQSIAIDRGGDWMPKGGPALTEGQKWLVRRWIETGAIDNGVCEAPCDSSNFTYSGAIAPMMAKYCTGCHSSPSAQGGALTDYASVREAAVNGKLIGNIAHLPGYNPMPPVGVTLSDCQVNQVRNWVASGAPNN